MRITHQALLAVVGVLAAGAGLGIALLWPPPGDVVEETAPQQASRLIDGTLVDVVEIPGSGDETFGLVPGAVLVDVTARIEETGELVEFTMLDDTGDTFAPGQRVRLQEIQQADGETAYLVSDFRRERPLLLLFALFVFAVVAFGRLQGVRALGGLVLTFVLIVAFIVPAILGGRDPVLVALVGAVAIMIVTLYLSHGFSRKTTAAVVGTAVALALTGALAVLFVAAAQITGFTSEEARLANVEVGGLSLTGLLLAGIIIGGLGVLDDVTMSQSSTVFELHRANPSATFADLLRGALSVGRDHIAATVNTLFLAYAGASLPLLILFVTGIDPFGTIITSEIVAVEVVRTLVGSIGLIAAVPLTTALAAGIVLGDPEAAKREALLGHTHGHAHGAAPRHAGEVEPEAHGRDPRSTPPPAAPSTPRRGPSAPSGDSTGDDEDDWVGRLRDAYRTDGPDEG